MAWILTTYVGFSFVQVLHNSDFKTLDEIMEVKGIGKGIFKKIKSAIALDKGITDLVDTKTIKKPAKASKTSKTEAASKKNKVLDKNSKANQVEKPVKKAKRS